jgi:GAF domain-containing protein
MPPVLAKLNRMSISLHPDTSESPAMAASPDAGAARAAGSAGTKIRSRLFTKYVALFVAVVAVALLSNGIFEVFFYYREHKAALIRIQHEQAEAAAAKIGQFIKEIESQLGWTAQLPWSAKSIEDRRFDALRLLKQVPAITELAQVDSTGIERLRVSRLAMDSVAGAVDLSKDPKFTEAVANKVYYGPVYFRRESEPYMTLSLAGTRKEAGVSIAEVNLKLIRDVVSQIKVGEHGQAYVVDAEGRLIAHPDISLVLRNTDMSKLLQVQAARAGSRNVSEELQGTKNIQGQEVLTASAPIAPLGWTMFVELPVEEAYASLYQALQRLAIVLLGASILAVLAGIFLARRMIVPIQALRAGAERIGGGDFTQHISIKTGDEFEGLANQFNDMGARLQESYSGLEQKVEARTRELSESLEQQTATSEILSVISSSPGELEPVFKAMLENATRVCASKFGTMYLREGDAFRTVAMYGAPPAYEEVRMREPVFRPGPGTGLGRAAQTKQVVHVADATAERAYTERDSLRTAAVEQGGVRTLIAVPMLKESELVGVIAIYRQEVRPFTDKQIQLVTNFAAQAVIAIENTRLLKELRQRTGDLSEALEQQTAISDILRAMSSSPGDVKPVFASVAEHAARICEAQIVDILTVEDDRLHYAAEFGEFGRILHGDTAPLNRDSVMGRSICDKQPVHVVDLQSADHDFPLGREYALALGHRTTLAVPLIREDRALGTILVRRAEVRPFDDKHIALLKTFADQAAIAIENARLLNELRQRTRELQESLEYQTATADVLNVISRSTTNVQPVFDAIATSAARLFAPCETTLTTVHDGQFHWGATASLGRPVEAIERVKSIYPLPFDIERSPSARAVHERRIIEIPDASAPGTPDSTRRAQSAGEFRSITFVPLLRDGVGIGTIILTHPEAGFKLSPKQLALVQTFADQAVIAIENARLFDEVQAKTGELTEALVYQTGSGNILKVIASSPTDVKPVLKAIVDSASEICEAIDAVVLLKDGDDLRFSEHHGSIPIGLEKWPINRTWTAGRAFLDQKPVHVHDLRSSEGDEFPDGRELSLRMGHRSILSVPLLRENESIGAIVLRRAEVQPFNEKQITLLQTFADQAVIALGNVRLFEEVQERTKELSESLQFQTATSEVLKVISRSPDALQPVLDVIVKISQELCNSDASTIFLLRDEKFHVTAVAGIMPVHLDTLRANPAPVDQPGSILARIAREKRTLHYANVADDPELKAGITGRGGPRTLLTVPLMRDGEVMGAITMRRSPNLPFSVRQIEAIEAFADQAVIAISNVGLFEQVQAKTSELTETLEYQTATADVLNVISRSPNNLQPVMDTIVHTARRLCQSEYAMMLQCGDDGIFRIAAHSNVSQEFIDWMQENPVTAGDGSAVGMVAAEKQTIHLPDALAEPRFTDRRRQQHSKARTMLGVPLLRDQNVIGVVFMARTEVKPFSDRQVELVTSFADQAVIAINNVRLFDEVQERTRELTQSLDELRTAQDRLVQTEKLASLGQLTAGIAHEIKNPLNFVNNFSALSAELIDELNDALKPAALDGKVREEIDELTHMLKGNLEKVVQHGKRADSIVKNMLLHSREGAGEHRPADINAIVEESLNLAYHGARAERSGFNITLQRDLDPDAGMIDLYPQEITRVFLNLISNGFYAATKRKEAGDDGFEPTLSASTRSLGNKVEIRIRDNGTGIPLEVKEKMFNPFFTTKPAGEGTGLGLSMSHDIVVKQHGGKIDVDTEPGAFTEFIITLPRTAAAQIQAGGTN